MFPSSPPPPGRQCEYKMGIPLPLQGRSPTRFERIKSDYMSPSKFWVMTSWVAGMGVEMMKVFGIDGVFRLLINKSLARTHTQPLHSSKFPSLERLIPTQPEVGGVSLARLLAKGGQPFRRGNFQRPTLGGGGISWIWWYGWAE